MGGSTPKGEARGECANVLPERDQDANQTHIGQSKAFRQNKTKMKTAFRRARLEKDTKVRLFRWLSRDDRKWL
jgi:hypothetical protein